MSTQMIMNPDNPMLPVESDILGLLTVPEAECLTFPEGILGFPACHRFILVPTSKPELFWLQSVDHGSLAFLLVDPFAVVEGFTADLSDSELTVLKPGDPKQMGVLAIVTLPRGPGDVATANLQGLLALNFNRRIGRQIIVQNSEWGTRWQLDPNRLKAAS
jgi:flagellar assembly factor FliW